MSEMKKFTLTVYWNTEIWLKQTTPSPCNGNETYWKLTVWNCYGQLYFL